MVGDTSLVSSETARALFGLAADDEAARAFVEGVIQGFLGGVAVGFVLFLAAYLAWLLWRGRGTCRGVTIPGESGDLFVTILALREFVTRILYEFHEASLRNVSLARRGAGLVLTIEADALPDTDLVSLQDRIGKRVLEEAGDKVGMDKMLSRVNVTIHSYTANEAKIAKQKRRGPGRPLVMPVHEAEVPNAVAVPETAERDEDGDPELGTPDRIAFEP